MYLGCAPLLTLLTDMVGAPQNELAPFAPERRAEIPVIRGNATICRIGHDCLFSGEIAARGDSDAYATEGTAVHCVVERSATANLFNDLTDFYPPAAATNSPALERITAASSWRTPPSRPRASARSRRSACGLRGGRRPASIAMAGLPAPLRLHDPADDFALTQHVVVVLAPLAGQAGSRRAFED